MEIEDFLRDEYSFYVDIYNVLESYAKVYELAHDDYYDKRSDSYSKLTTKYLEMLQTMQDLIVRMTITHWEYKKNLEHKRAENSNEQ